MLHGTFPKLIVIISFSKEAIEGLWNGEAKLDGVWVN